MINEQRRHTYFSMYVQIIRGARASRGFARHQYQSMFLHKCIRQTVNGCDLYRSIYHTTPLSRQIMFFLFQIYQHHVGCEMNQIAKRIFPSISLLLISLIHIHLSHCHRYFTTVQPPCFGSQTYLPSDPLTYI